MIMKLFSWHITSGKATKATQGPKSICSSDGIKYLSSTPEIEHLRVKDVSAKKSDQYNKDK